MKLSTGCWHKGLSILLSSTMNVHSSTSVIKNFRPWGILNFLSDTTFKCLDIFVIWLWIMSWPLCTIGSLFRSCLSILTLHFTTHFFLQLYSKNEYIISFDMGNREGNLNFVAWTFLCSKMFCLIPNMCDIFAFILTCWQFLLYCTDNRCMLTWKRKGILE